MAKILGFRETITEIFQGIMDNHRSEIPSRKRNHRIKPYYEASASRSLNLSFIVGITSKLERDKIPFAISTWEEGLPLERRIKSSKELSNLFKLYFTDSILTDSHIRIYDGDSRDEVYLDFSFWKNNQIEAGEEKLGKKPHQVPKMYGSVRFFSEPYSPINRNPEKQ